MGRRHTDARADLQLSRAQARRIALVGPGLPRPSPHHPGHAHVLPHPGAHRRPPDRLGQRAPAGPLHAALLPDGSLRHRPARAGVRPAPARVVEYWAHVAAYMPVDLWPYMHHRMAAYAERGHAWTQEPGLGPADRDADVARSGGGAEDAARPRRRAPARAGDWGWNWSETKRALEYLFIVGTARRVAPQQPVRAGLRPARAGDPAGVLARPGAHPARDQGRAPATGGEVPRRRHGSLPARLLPPPARAWRDHADLDARHRGARRVRGAAAGLDRGMGPAGLGAPRRRAAAQGRGPGAAQPVRPVGVGARAHRAPLRLPLPHRDLRPRGEAAVRLLRAPVPARRPDRRPVDLKADRRAGVAARPGVVLRARCAAGDRSGARRGAARARGMAGARRRRGGATAATCPRPRPR